MSKVLQRVAAAWGRLELLYLQGPMVIGGICFGLGVATLSWRGGTWLLELYWFAALLMFGIEGAEAAQWRRIAQKHEPPTKGQKRLRKIGYIAAVVGLIALGFAYSLRRAEVLRLIRSSLPTP